MLNSNKILERLEEIVGRRNVTNNICDTYCYSRDFYLPEHILPPKFVVKPQTTEQVAEIVKLANQSKIPLVPRGGGTSFAGSASPVEGCIVIDLTGMNRILEIDEENMTVTVQAGVVLETLDAELNKHGFKLGHDPTSRPSATIGGAIAHNSTGWTAAKYGRVGNQVLTLELVLPQGEIIKIGGKTYANSASNLLRLFIGSEGTLGIFTEATLRVFPLPEKQSLNAYLFKDFETAWFVSNEFRKVGIIPAIQEIKEYATDNKEKKGLLIFGFEGAFEEVSGLLKRTSKICKLNSGEELNENFVKEFWKNRHIWYPKRELGFLWSEENSVPLNRVLEAYRRYKEIVGEHKLIYAGASIWGADPVLVGISFYFNEKSEEEYKRFSQCVREIAKTAVDLGGTLTAAHGIGVKLSSLMEYEHGKALDVMKRIKEALDPNHVMNPGKMGL